MSLMAGSLTVVNVAFPFAAVDADPIGGAEQVLARLDRALVAAGHRSIVIAPEGSSVAGTLVPVPASAGTIDEAARTHIHGAVRAALRRTLRAVPVDVVHLHGIDFDAYLPPPGPAVLVTLHLPFDWYPRTALAPGRPRTWLHPVSAAQAALAPEGVALAPPIENGVETPLAPATAPGGAFALCMGRICPEKGFDEALDAAARAGARLLIAGTVFPYPAHEAYFRTEIVPRLDHARRWVGAVTGPRKARLLARARCLLVPSKVPETSSLVAMEALAAGTPVIAYRAGALAEIVEHGRTGFLVDDVAGMAAAVRAAGIIDPVACRRAAAARFPLHRMTDAYLTRYAELAAA